ncbi:MAG: hypothetical protein ORN28_11110 [Rhodoferax sp.]|nr:hypothetical protein [Rhodoferax sp.]
MTSITQPQVLISDRHIGTTQWQHAMLQQIGVPVVSATLSNHSHYAPPGMLHTAAWLGHLRKLPRCLIDQQLQRDQVLCATSLALCSFPPVRVLELLRLPERVRLMVNVGHRIHIHALGWTLGSLTRRFEELMRNPRLRWACMSRFDVEYTRYYCGGAPLPLLDVACLHVPQQLRQGTYAPKNRVVLIGPSHQQGNVPGLASIEDLNRLSRKRAQQLGREPFTFSTIRSAYPDGQATAERLARHPAVVMAPYSAFSISMVELYQLNLPTFFPADGLLVDAMHDVKLHPIYQHRFWAERLDRQFAERARSLGYPYSPNSLHPDAQRYWLQHMYFNQVRNAQRFDSTISLLQQLYAHDLAALSAAMQTENNALCTQQTQLWRQQMGIAASQ